MSGFVHCVLGARAGWPSWAALAAGSCAGPLAAQPWTPADTLGPPLPVARGSFGAAVAIHGLRAVIGEPGAGGHGGQGAAHLLERRDRVWVRTGTLVPGSAAPGARFGESVAIRGERVAVGAPLDTAAGYIAAGAVYEFRRGIETARLPAPVPAAGDRFGVAVSVSSTNKTIAGAPGDDNDRGKDAGSAVVRRWYLLQGWRDEALLMAPDGAAGDAFGSAVALDQWFCVVGAPYADRAGQTDAGSAYLFASNFISWSFQALLHASQPSAGALFGASVGLEDDWVVIGAPLDDEPLAPDAGSAYVFPRLGAPGVRLTAPDAAAGDHFGAAVAISADRVLIGAPGRDSRGRPDAGAVYVFVMIGGTWTHEATLEAPAAAAGDALGRAVALSIGKACLGARRVGLGGLKIQARSSSSMARRPAASTATRAPAPTSWMSSTSSASRTSLRRTRPMPATTTQEEA